MLGLRSCFVACGGDTKWHFTKWTSQRMTEKEQMDCFKLACNETWCKNSMWTTGRNHQQLKKLLDGYKKDPVTVLWQKHLWNNYHFTIGVKCCFSSFFFLITLDIFIRISRYLWSICFFFFLRTLWVWNYGCKQELLRMTPNKAL